MPGRHCTNEHRETGQLRLAGGFNLKKNCRLRRLHNDARRRD